MATFFFGGGGRYITWHCFTSNVIHVNWTNIIQITDMRLQVMVFSLYKEEITIHSYNETNYKVKTRKSYWNLNSGCKMLSSEMSTCLDCNTQQTSYIRTKSTLQCVCQWSASHWYVPVVCLTLMWGTNTARNTGLKGEDEKRQYRNFCGSGIWHDSSTAEDTSLLAHYTVSLDRWFSTFWKDRGAFIFTVPAAFLDCLTLKMKALQSLQWWEIHTQQDGITSEKNSQLLGKLSGKRGLLQTSHIHRVSQQYKNISESLTISLSVLNVVHPDFSTLTTFVYVIHIFVPTTLLLRCILQQHSSYQT
jgi:hypothetical protein